MENAFSYALGSDSRMQGGDSRYNRLAQDLLFKDVNPDIELEVKSKKVTDKVSEALNVIANEPSLAFFRIQEHVRKCLPQLVETKHEVQELQQKIQGSSFDTEYAANAVKQMQDSSCHFENIQDLLKNAIFVKQQIDYEKSRREQEKLHPSMYTTKSSPSINADNRPTRQTRHHSTSSDRSSQRSREKHILSGHANRPHSSCGVLTNTAGHEVIAADRSRAGMRDPYSVKKPDGQVKETTYLESKREDYIASFASGNVIDDSKDLLQPETASKYDQQTRIPFKVTPVKSRKTKGVDAASLKTQFTCKHGHEGKACARKSLGLTKSTKTKTEDFYHSHNEGKECGKRMRKDKYTVISFHEDSAKAVDRSLLERREKVTKAVTRSKEVPADTSGMSGFVKSSKSRKESFKGDVRLDKQEELAKRHSFNKSANTVRQPGHKNDDPVGKEALSPDGLERANSTADLDP